MVTSGWPYNRVAYLDGNFCFDHIMIWNGTNYRLQRPLVALLLLSSPPPDRLPEILYACVVRTRREVLPPLDDLAALPRHAQWTRSKNIRSMELNDGAIKRTVPCRNDTCVGDMLVAVRFSLD